MTNQVLMTGTAVAVSDATSHLLDRFGLAIGPGGVQITDEGIEALQAAGYLSDWAKLVALYPGW